MSFGFQPCNRRGSQWFDCSIPRCARAFAPARLTACCLLLWPLFMAGCFRTSETQQADRLEKSAERGPLRLTVQVQPATVWVADPVQVEMIFLAPADHVVRFPEADAFGDWTTTNGELVGPRPTADGRSEWRRSYTIRANSAGTREIPPLVVQYARKPPEDDPVFDNELATGTLPIEVRSALTTQDSVESPRDITGTLTPSQHWTTWDIAMAILAVKLALGATLLAAWGARRWLSRPLPPELPETLALRELAALSTADWENQSVRQAFFYRVSEIVRWYIERKFGLSAPEMTTEEFLSSLSRGSVELPYDCERLRVFLETCDRVKYAAFQPRREDGDETLAAARSFIHTTAAVSASREQSTSSERAA